MYTFHLAGANAPELRAVGTAPAGAPLRPARGRRAAPVGAPAGPLPNNRKGAVLAKEKKETQIHLRISERDAALMRERARAAGLGLSAYVRRCALAGGAPAPVADARELRPIYAELRRCGNNANQIARALNTYGIGGAPAADVARAVAELERAAEAVAAALEAARP